MSPRPLETFRFYLWLLPWLLCFGLTAHGVLAQVGHPSIVVSADVGGGYPVIAGFVGPIDHAQHDVALGDRVVAIDGIDLRGTDELDLYPIYAAHRGESSSVRMQLRRGERDVEARVPVWTYREYWPRAPASLVFALVALLLVRRRRSVASLALAHAFMAAAVFLACTFSGPEPIASLAIAAHLISLGLVQPLSLRAALRFPEGSARQIGLDPDARWLRIAPWAFASLALFEGSRFYEMFMPRAIGMVAMTAGNLAFFGLLLTICTLYYRRADPLVRRQMKWVMLAVYLAVAVPVCATLLAHSDVEFFAPLVVSMAALALIPLALWIAITRYDILDVDRLLSATAAYSLLVGAVIAGVLSVLPFASSPLAQSLELGEDTLRPLMLGVGAATVLIAERVLRPAIDRWMFADRHRFDSGMADLLRELSDCAHASELFTLSCERVFALVGPESVAVLTRGERGFAPVVVQGSAVPLRLEPDSPLLARLVEAGGPLATRDLRAAFAKDERGLDRCALDALELGIWVPVLRSGVLIGVLSLGAKRSGDVYTATDRALLAALGDKLATQLARFDQGEVIREGDELRLALRSYVPGALAQAIEQRHEIGAGSREVSVLFVDIRGYTQFAEGRSADEVFATVSAYTRRVSEIVVSHGGTIVEFNGDGMMAVFGAPRAILDKERAATDAGREIVGSHVAVTWAGIPLDVRVGVATGDAFVGSIHALDRKIWSAIGNTTNLAARLQSLTRELSASMAIDDCTHERAGYSARGFVSRPQMRIRGRQRPENVYVLPLEAFGAESLLVAATTRSAPPPYVQAS